MNMCFLWSIELLPYNVSLPPICHLKGIQADITQIPKTMNQAHHVHVYSTLLFLAPEKGLKD